MTTHKWAQFRAALQADGAQKSYADWGRLIQSAGSVEDDFGMTCHVRINGQSLEEMQKTKGAGQLDVHSKVNDVLAEMLNNYKGADRVRCEQYLLNNFNQGGLLNAVTRSIIEVLNQTDSIYKLKDSGMVVNLDIKSEEQGISITETLKATQIFNDDADELENPEGYINAKATLFVNLSGAAPKINCVVDAFQTTPEFEKVFDNRNVFQIIMDFIKNLLGIDKGVNQNLTTASPPEKDAEPILPSKLNL